MKKKIYKQVPVNNLIRVYITEPIKSLKKAQIVRDLFHIKPLTM